MKNTSCSSTHFWKERWQTYVDWIISQTTHNLDFLSIFHALMHFHIVDFESIFIKYRLLQVFWIFLSRNFLLGFRCFMRRGWREIIDQLRVSDKYLHKLRFFKPKILSDIFTFFFDRSITFLRKRINSHWSWFMLELMNLVIQIFKSYLGTIW